MPDKKPFKKPFTLNYSSASLGITMAVGMGVFTYLGYRIGRKSGHSQEGALAGVFLGLLYCGYEVWKQIRIYKNGNGGI